MAFLEYLQLPSNCDGDDDANEVPKELNPQMRKPKIYIHE
jgi:hypothetical protein